MASSTTNQLIALAAAGGAGYLVYKLVSNWLGGSATTLGPISGTPRLAARPELQGQIPTHIAPGEVDYWLTEMSRR